MKKYVRNINYLLGCKIDKIIEDESSIIFIANNISKGFKINKFEAYCCCNVGEYIDEISKDGECLGTITKIEQSLENIYNDEIVYKGNITFYFGDSKLNMKVHGEDSGFYGVCFSMPTEVINLEGESK